MWGEVECGGRIEWEGGPLLGTLSVGSSLGEVTPHIETADKVHGGEWGTRIC